jgi:hypothetical protein
VTVTGATGLPGGRWLVLGKDSRLTAYARADGGLLRWTELRAGGPAWSRPEFVPGPHLTHVSVVQGADTYVHFLGRRELPRAEGVAQVDIVHAIQYQTGRAVTEWRSLGSPYRDPANAARFGAPCGAVDSTGTVYVFARNAGNGVTMRRESPSGKWESWKDLRGSKVVEGVAAVGLSTGRVEVLAPTASAALHWSQTEPGGPLQGMQTIPLAPKEGSVVGLETSPGRVTYYWTDQAGTGLVAYRPGEWWGGIGGSPSDSPVSVVRASIDGHDCTVLAHTALDGQVMLAACGTENEGSGLWWSPTGEECVGAPGLAVDARGRVVLAVVGKDGDLRIARQSPEPGLALAPAARV